MIWTPHILLGAALAIKISPLALGLFLAFLSHYVLDFLPHWEYSVKNIKSRQWRKALPEFTKIVLDGFFGILLVVILARKNPLALIGAMIAISPDWLTLFYYIFPQKRFLQIHPQALHSFKNEKIPQWGKVAIQIIVAILAIVLLIV